jgi:uncharacterized membrane protein YvbJ
MKMRCPECGLENPKEAQLCDCGHEFKEGDQGMTDKEYRKRNNRTLRIDICRIALEAIILAIIIQFIPKNIGAIPYLVIYFFAISCIELFYRK